MILQKLTNGTFEDEMALINVNTTDVLIKGDSYHDKIDERIEGFLEGLLYANVEYTLIKDKTIMSHDNLFDICDFSNEDYNLDDDDERDFDLLDDMDDDEVVDSIIKDIKIEILPHSKKHTFRIISPDTEMSCFGDIMHVLDEVKNCDGDLFLTDGGQYSIVYSCQGLDLEDNNACLQKFGVCYEKDEHDNLKLKVKPIQE